MNISLIGMSGSGKSHWSKQLKKYGFMVYCVDDMIEQKLGSALTKLGYHGINDMARWMGQPFDEQYQETSRTYLHLENEVLRELLANLSTTEGSKDVILDTTGSVIYTDSVLHTQLKTLTKVVYLETPADVQEQMYAMFMKDPKPIIWGESFVRQSGETELEALRRCYPELLAFRTKAYEQLAHKAISYHTLRKKDFTVEQFIQEVMQ